jgi:hypothetical protein
VIVGLIALTTAALFAGAAYYVSAVEHPARLQIDDRNVLAQWKPSYARGAVMQASLALASSVLGFVAAWLMQDWRWAVGAVLMLANWPYTLLVIMPTNNALKAIPLEAAGPDSRALLVKWGKLHAVRTALGCAAMLVYLWAGF